MTTVHQSKKIFFNIEFKIIEATFNFFHSFLEKKKKKKTISFDLYLLKKFITSFLNQTLSFPGCWPIEAMSC